MRSTDFFQSSRGIVEGFLTSVIAIDDQLCFDNQQLNLTSDEDPFKAMVLEDNGLGHADVIAVSSPTENTELNPQLNYQDLSLAFASYGINCCAFRPDQNRFESIEAAATQITISAQRTDITILDWSMDSQFSESAGTLARKSILKILEEDKSQLGRLRLIVIYTAENPDKIAEQILEVANQVDLNAVLDGRNVQFKDSDLEFCQISVIEKSVNVTALCDEVICLFTEQTAGLLSNAALASIGELRNKTHHILHSFNKHLDPAYLSHIMCLKASEKARETAHEVAFDYATDIISEEFKSNLQISQTLKEHLSLNRLKRWVDLTGQTQVNREFDFVLDGKPFKITPERFNKLLEVTQQEELNKVLDEQPKINIKNFKKIQINLNGENRFPHENLSAIECKRRDILSLKTSEHLPNIKQGTILKENDQYYLCVQPLCDSVRIFEDSNFLFLKINKVDDKFSHVLKDESGNFIKFKIAPGSKSLHIFKFPPDPTSRTIKCEKKGGELKVSYIQANGFLCYLTWVGELKSNIAQSISNDLASKISRVGLDTNEWLRGMQ